MIKCTHEIWHTCILISQCYKYTTKKPWSRLKIRWKWNKSRNLWKPCKIWNCEYYARFCWVQSKKRFVDLWKRDLYPYPWGLLPNVEALMSHVKREGKWEVGGRGADADFVSSTVIGKIHASRKWKGNFKSFFLYKSFQGNHEVFTSLEKTIMGHVYFRRQITPQAGS